MRKKYVAKIRENIPDYCYGMSDLDKCRGKIIYLLEDNGTYLDNSKYRGRRPQENNSGVYYWKDDCFEWVKEIT